MGLLIAVCVLFVAVTAFAGWLLLRPEKPEPTPASIADELRAYKMANDKYRGRLSAKQRAAANRAYRDATRPNGGSR